MRAEIRLRVPNMKVRVKDANGYPIDHSAVRFRRVIEIPAFPRVGTSLDLPTQSGITLQGVITHVVTDEERGLFVLSCQYSERIITPDRYAALADDPEWQLKDLLE